MSSSFVARGVVVVVSVAAVVGLTACTPSSIARTVAAASEDVAQAGDDGYVPSDRYGGDSGYSESGYEPVEVDGPVDWPALDTCDDDWAIGEWTLVGGFPTSQVDDSGISPFCGASYADTDGTALVGAVATATSMEVFLLGGKLVSAGYSLSYDDFTPEDYEGTGSCVGARDYTLGESTVTISAYDNGVRPLSLTVFIDYSGPETRAAAGPA